MRPIATKKEVGWTLEEILRHMEQARMGRQRSWDLIFQIADQKRFKKQVETCRLILCEKHNVRPTNSLLNLLGSSPAKRKKIKKASTNKPGSISLNAPSKEVNQQVTTSSSKTSSTKPRVLRCTQCDGIAMLGDDRCFIHMVIVP